MNNKHNSIVADLSPSLKEKIFTEQLDITFKQIGVVSKSSLGPVFIMSFLAWNTVPALNVYVWLFIGITFVSFNLALLAFLYDRAKPPPRELKKWAKWLMICGTVASISLSAAGLLLFSSDSVEHQYILLLTLSIGAAITTIQSAAYQPYFYAATIPLILPISARFVLEGDLIHVVVGITTPIIYLTTLAFFYKNIHQTLLESLRLRFEKAQLAEQLETQKEAADKANTEKSRFIAAASHDLRQPLHAQGFFVSDLKNKIRDSECYETLNQLQASINRMHDSFTSLLDLSKLEADMYQPDINTFALQIVFNELQTDYTIAASNKGLKLRFINTSILVKSDPAMFARIMRNFLSNAIRYTEHGKILIGCRRKAETARIEVWDTGIGIPKNKLDSIFDEYKQVKQNPEQGSGLGLGLAIVDRIAHLLKHPVHVRSELNRGSVFAVDLPYGAPAELFSKNGLSTEVEYHDLADTSILVIDDDPSILYGMRKTLTNWGCHVLTAASYPDALERAKNFNGRLSVVMSDLKLQGTQSGITTIRDIQNLFPYPIPGMLITGETSSVNLQDTHNSNLPVLYKPVAPAKLRSLISHLINETPHIRK